MLLHSKAWMPGPSPGMTELFLPSQHTRSSSRDPEAKPTYVGGVAGSTPSFTHKEPSLARGRKVLGEIGVRPRDDVDRDQGADGVGGFGAGFGRGLHRADIAVDDDGDQAVT